MPTRDVADEAAQMLADGLVIRQSLIAMCDEMQHAMAAVAAKLEALSPAEPTNGNWARTPAPPRGRRVWRPRTATRTDMAATLA